VFVSPLPEVGPPAHQPGVQPSVAAGAPLGWLQLTSVQTPARACPAPAHNSATAHSTNPATSDLCGRAANIRH
jgi:hypothetical protein